VAERAKCTCGTQGFDTAQTDSPANATSVSRWSRVGSGRLPHPGEHFATDENVAAPLPRVCISGVAQMKRFAVFVGAIALVFVAAGCKAQITRHVLILGDSLTVGAIPELHDELTLVQSGNDEQGRYLITPDAVGGIGGRVVPGTADARAYWAAHLESVRDHADPEVWVIALGTNDCQRGDYADWGTTVDFFLSRIPSDKPVVWPTLTSQRSSHGDCVATINAALTDATTRWPNLMVPDMRGAMQDVALFAADGFHFAAAGDQAFAEFLHQTLDDAFVDHEVPTTTTTTTTTTVPETTTTTVEEPPTTTTEAPTTTTTEVPPDPPGE
jgi:lysophospholipase L1-like esterase